MRQPKLTGTALALAWLIIYSLACNKGHSDNPPSATTPPANGNPATTDCNDAANGPAKVVCLSNAFLSTLNSSQLASAQLDLSQPNAVHWSNLPCGSSCRNGLEFTNMTTAQIAAAKAIIAAATGTGNDAGYNVFSQIMQADSVPNYFIAFLGTPSLAGNWQLQFGGHDLAINISYKDGVVKGSTPMFQGADPHTGNTSDKSGTITPPLAGLRSALVTMLSSLSKDQLAGARLSSTFNDVMLGPGSDGGFPATKAGLDISTLTTPQQDQVLAAIKLWAQNADSATAASLITRYTLELSETYIAYSNTPFLTSGADYVRIDGPSVWIEFVCQPGGAGMLASQIHYNSVWRDHKRDYGGNFVF